MTDQLIAKKPEPIGIIKPKLARTCGNCEYGKAVPQDLTVVACNGLPPQMIVTGYTPAGPQMALLYPNLPRSQPGCALFAQRGLQDGERSN